MEIMRSKNQRKIQKKDEATSTYKFVSEMTEEERKAHDKNKEEESKSDGSMVL